MRLTKQCKTLVILTTICSLNSLNAEDLLLDEHALLIDIPTVTSATRLTQHLSDAPVSMTVIDRATIQASGAQTVPDLFRLVPGFQVAHVNSNKYAVTYHGHSDDFPRRLEVMIDGRSVYFPIISAVDWASLGLHLDDIERIEVIRGSNTATYGSNAFMGAINIITRHPATESRFASSGVLGSLNTANVNLRYSSSNSMGHFRVSAANEQNNGSKLFNDGAYRSYLNLSTSLAPTLHDQIDIRLGVDKGNIRIGELKPANGDPENLFIPERIYRSYFQHIHWQRALNDHLSIGVTAYHNYLQLSEQSPTLNDLFKSGFKPNEATILLENNPNFKFLNEDGASRQKDLELFVRNENRRINTHTGIGIRESSASSDTLFEQGRVESTRYRIFNNTSFFQNEFLTWNLGFLHEAEESGPKATSLRAALNWHINHQLTFRFGHSQSQRLPSLHESSASSTIMLNQAQNIIFDAVRRPNPEISSEDIKSNEIGILYNFANLPGYIDLRIFDEYITNGIESYVIPFAEYQFRESNNGQPKTTTRAGFNISSWNNRGAEIQLKLQPDPNLWLLLNYAYINSTKDQYFNGERVIARNELAPRHTASALLNWQPVFDLNLSATHYYLDRMHWFSGDTKQAYNRTDLRVAKKWSPSSQTQAETALVIQNAFGPSYKEFYDYHDFERRIFLTFRLKYD